MAGHSSTSSLEYLNNVDSRNFGSELWIRPRRKSQDQPRRNHIQANRDYSMGRAAFALGSALFDQEADLLNSRRMYTTQNFGNPSVPSSRVGPNINSPL